MLKQKFREIAPDRLLPRLNILFSPTDKSFEEKLKANHLGKSGNFAKASTKTDRNAHFGIVHYAGTVSYNLVGMYVCTK